MVGAQSSKRPRLASQQYDAVVDLSNEHEQLLSSNISIMEANASFALSTSRSNASNSSSMVCAQSSERPLVASQQYDAVADLSNKSLVWVPHEQLLLSNISILDVPRDGNCLFHACTSHLQNLLNLTDFTIEQAIDMMNNLMEYLLRHANNPSVSGDPDSLTWSVLAMHYASEIESELRPKPHSLNAIVSTLEHYA